MRILRQVAVGIVLALASIGLILGGFSLAFAENHNFGPIPLPPSTNTVISIPAILFASPTPTPSTFSQTEPPVPTLMTSLNETASPLATFTPHVTTPTTVSCSPPPGWIVYIVQPGDNLFRIGLAYNIPYQQLQQANCLASSFIHAGQRLYVPNVPTRTPAVTWTPYTIPTDMFQVSETPTTPPDTATPTGTDTMTPTPVPTNSSVPTESPSPTP